MRNRVFVQAVASIVVLVFALGILFTGGEVELGWLRFYSVAVLIAVIVLNLWDRWLWRLPVSQRLQAVPRDIRGTWRGTLTSLWVDPETGKTPPRKLAFLVVRQTASTVTAQLLTNELRSMSTMARVEMRDGQHHLQYLFVGEPKPEVEHRSRMHRGATLLIVEGRPANRIAGRYWTDRDSKGELVFDARHRDTADSYEAAMSAFHDE